MKRKRVEGIRYYPWAVCIALCLFLTPLSYAGVEIADMQFSFSTAQFYDGTAGEFSFDENIQNLGEISILTSPTEGDYEYKIQGGSVAISNSAYSAGTDTFVGGITLTISGMLTDADGTALTAANSNLITATMIETEWTIGTAFSTPMYTMLASDLTHFATTGGLLSGGGVEDADAGTSIFIDDFTMFFKANAPASFDGFDADNASGLVTLEMQTDAEYIPEPATLALLSLGAVLLSKKRRNT